MTANADVIGAYALGLVHSTPLLALGVRARREPRRACAPFEHFPIKNADAQNINELERDSTYAQHEMKKKACRKG